MRKMFIKITAILLLLCANYARAQQDGFGYLKKAYYGTQQDVEAMQYLAVDATGLDQQITLADNTVISNVTLAELREALTQHVNATLGYGNLQDALANSTFELMPSGVQIQSMGFNGRWINRNPYPGEMGWKDKSGTWWWSGWCYNPILLKTGSAPSPTSAYRKSTYGPPPVVQQQTYQQQQNVVYADYRYPEREVRYQQPEVQYVQVPAEQSERRRNPWNKNLNINIDPGTLLMGIASVKQAWDGYKIRTQNENINRNYVYVDRQRGYDRYPRPQYPRYPNRGRGIQLGTDGDASGGHFNPSTNPFYDGTGNRGPRVYSNTWGNQNGISTGGSYVQNASFQPGMFSGGGGIITH